jgi:hypothetical protein
MAGEIKLNSVNFASELGGTITLNNGTLGSGVVFPAGHIISHSTPFFDTGLDAAVTTGSSSYQESGVEVSLTTKLSSSSSRIVIQFYTGFARMVGSNSAVIAWTVGRATASSTTYSSATDLTEDQSSYFYSGASNTYWSQHSTWIDTGSYLANTTYYYQIYFRSINSTTTDLARQGATVSMLAYEVKI